MSKFNRGNHKAKVLARRFKVNKFEDDVLEIECQPTEFLTQGGNTPIEGNNRAWVEVKVFHEEWQDGKKVRVDKTKPHENFMPSMRALGVPEGKEMEADTCAEFASEIVIWNKPNGNGDKVYDNWRLSLPRADGPRQQSEPPKTDPTVKARLQMALGGKPAQQPSFASAADGEDCPF